MSADEETTERLTERCLWRQISSKFLPTCLYGRGEHGAAVDARIKPKIILGTGEARSSRSREGADFSFFELRK